jgi:preprotein translocase subunit SecE
MAANGKVEEMKKSPIKRFVEYFKEIKAETHRITWPSKADAKKATIAVVSFCAMYVVLVAVMDFGLSNLFTVIFK